ncbi:MAG: MBL fold metallo-hydrolase, partial [Treponema sp.]|nr:MBL fold metallo-hydrolase [Treponema sp.]
MQKDGIFSYKVGRFEVFVMVESEGPGSAEILVGADEGLLKKLIPAEGFKRSVNAFLVRTHGAPGGDLNVLVDVGTGQPPEPIFEKIRKVGVEPERIDEALITHLHGDHFAGLLREGKPAFANAKVRLSKKEFDYFTAEKPNQNAISVLAAYGDRALTFEPGELGSDPRELLPGITPIAAY